MTLARFDARVKCAHCLRFPFILPKDNLSLARSDARSGLSRVQCVRTLSAVNTSVPPVTSTRWPHTAYSYAPLEAAGLLLSTGTRHLPPTDTVRMGGEEQVYLSVVRQDIVKYDMMVKSLIQEIRELNGSQADLDDVGALVRSRISQLREQIEELKRLAQEEDIEEERCQLAEEAARSEKMLQDDHRAFRNALLAAQLIINQRSKDELLSKRPVEGKGEGEGEGTVRQRDRQTRELLLKDSSRLTEDLLTVTRLIQDNVRKSAQTVDTLVEGSQGMTGTVEELKTMGSVISQARKILNKYGRRENTDKLLIFLGLVFFFASCLVVVRNRFIF